MITKGVLIIWRCILRHTWNERAKIWEYELAMNLQVLNMGNGYSGVY